MPGTERIPTTDREETGTARKPPDPVAPSGRRVFTSRELLGGDKEITIVHGREMYRLRKTRLGKLILTK